MRKTESDEEENEEEDNAKPVKMFDDAADNPWNIDISPDFKDFVSGYRKFWTAKNKEALANENNKVANNVSNSPLVVENQAELQEKKSDSKSSENDEKSDLSDKEDESLNKLKRKRRAEMNAKKMKLDSSESLAEEQKTKRQKKSKGSRTPEKKKSEKSLEKKLVLDTNFSGLWIVSPVVEKECDKNNIEKKKELENRSNKNNSSIDDLFERAEKNLEKRIKQKLKKVNMTLINEVEEKNNSRMDSESDDDMELSVKNLRNNKQRPNEDVELLEAPGRGMAAEKEKLIIATEINSTPSNNISSFEIDPKKYIHVKPKVLNTKLPDEFMQDENVMDDAQEQKMTIMEAFADDDVISEFK